MKVFQLSGNFQWPSTNQAGTLQVHYRRRNGVYEACLNWIPNGQQDISGCGDPDERFAMEPDQAKFAYFKSDTVSLPGAAHFVQFPERPDERSFLLTARRAEQPVSGFSHARGDDTFTLSLFFPTVLPVPFRESENVIEDGLWVDFVYPVELSSIDDAALIDRAFCHWRDGKPPAEFELSSLARANRRIGGFDYVGNAPAFPDREVSLPGMAGKEKDRTAVLRKAVPRCALGNGDQADGYPGIRLTARVQMRSNDCRVNYRQVMQIELPWRESSRGPESSGGFISRRYYRRGLLGRYFQALCIDPRVLGVDIGDPVQLAEDDQSTRVRFEATVGGDGADEIDVGIDFDIAGTESEVKAGTARTLVQRLHVNVSDRLKSELQNLEPEQPTTFAPRLGFYDGDAMGLSVRLAGQLTHDPDTGYAWSPSALQRPPVLASRASRRARISVELPGYRGSGADLKLIGDVGEGGQPPVYSDTAAHRGSVSLALTELRPAKGTDRHGVLGGFVFDHTIDSDVKTPEVDGAAEPVDDGDAARLHDEFRFELSHSREADTLPAYRWKIDIPARSVEAVAIDRPRFSERHGAARALLIPGPAERPRDRGFVLKVTERGSERFDRELDVVLKYRDTQAHAEREYIVFGHEPMTLYRAYSRTLRARSSDEGTTVARWNSSNRLWKLSAVPESYRYRLPSQVVGDSMDKPGRLHVHDAPTTRPGELVKPVPDAAGRAELTLALDFRLAPATEFWVNADDIETSENIPEWDIAALFRQRGALGLGAPLVALRGEFLYGLMVGLSPANQTGPARGARVAEIGALAGVPRAADDDPELPPDFDGADFLDGWARVRAALLSRTERLEVWANDPDSVLPFAPAQFDSDISFSLRGTALHGWPLAGAPEQAPAGTGQAPRFHPKGLRGGALWPAESRNLLRELLRRPQASGGSIGNIALGPVGGDADQTARFLNGIVRVISETRQGYVQRQKLEVYGRIGVLWHRAKHVVVYERTSNYSPQFSPAGEENRSRRPVLRKTAEYVEILEPLRRYPEDAEIDRRLAGCVAGARFGSRVINVDSRWGAEVGDDAWTVPLWNRHAAVQRPQIYAMPDVQFLTHGEPVDGASEVAASCLNPENLNFYAFFKAESDDTDSWPARLGVDFCNSPLAQPRANGNKFQPSSRVEPGFARFTWRLDVSDRRTQINAARSSRPMFVTLDTVTFMRGAPAIDDERERDLREIGHAGWEEVADFDPDSLYWHKDGESGHLTDGLKARHTAAMAVSAAPDLAAARTALESLKRELGQPDDTQEWLVKVRAGASEFWDRPRPDRPPPRDSIRKHIGTAGSTCDRVAGDVLGAIARKRSRILRSIEQAERRLIARVPDLDPDLKAEIETELERALKRALAGQSFDFSTMGNDIETARAAVTDLGRDLRAQLARAQRRFTETVAGFDREKPWSKHRLEEFDTQRSLVFQRLEQNVDAAVQDAVDRLTNDIADSGQRLAAWLQRDIRLAIEQSGTRLDEVERLMADSFTTVSWQGKPLEDLDRLARRIAQLAAQASSPRKERLEELHGKLVVLHAKASAALADVEAALASAREAVKQGSTEARNLIAQAARQAQTIVGEVQTARNAAIAATADLGADVEAEVTEGLGALNADVAAVQNMLAAWIGRPGQWIDAQARLVVREVERLSDDIDGRLAEMLSGAQAIFNDLAEAAEEVGNALDPDSIVEHILKPQLVEPLAAEIHTLLSQAPSQGEIKDAIATLSDRAQALIAGLDVSRAEEVVSKAHWLCRRTVDDARDFLDSLTSPFKELADEARAEIDRLLGYLDSTADDLETKLARIRAFADGVERDIRRFSNDVKVAEQRVSQYSTRVLEAAGNLDRGGLSAVPNNLLRLYSAAASPPTLPNLDYARDRLSYYYRQVDDVVDMTRVEAWIDRFGDKLKAIGLSFDTGGIGSGLIPDIKGNFNEIINNIAGFNTNKLFSGSRLGAEANDAIKVTHDFDQKNAEAWVQIDIDLPLPGRTRIFSFGPFRFDFFKSKLTGLVRLEASKDTERVRKISRATIRTDLEGVVAGQLMVALRDFSIDFDESGNLSFDLDPKKIEINRVMKTINDVLQTIFPDDVGGLRIVKNRGVPVGVSYDFDMPPLSLAFGTTGISNLALSNHFELTAYPDFVLANKFSVASPEQPFIFSVWILGGAGWVSLQTRYRPLENRLLVIIDAAAGASAWVGFAFAGVTGSVYIAISINLTYRKLIGRRGGGLTVALVVIVAGNVDVLGIVHASMSVLLRLSYRDNGDITARGRLSMKIRVCRFFKIRVRTQVVYQMKGSKRVRRTTTKVDTSRMLNSRKKRAAA